jgi:hypothetical protein
MAEYTPGTAFQVDEAGDYSPSAEFVFAPDTVPVPNRPPYVPGTAFAFGSAALGYVPNTAFAYDATTEPPQRVIEVTLLWDLLWRLEATAVWTPVISATVYRFALENSQGRAELPISNFSGQLRSGEPSYLQVTIPDARAWAELIADFASQTDTEMVIQAGYRYSDGAFLTQEIARTRLRNVRYDLGARSSSVQLDGIDTRVNQSPKTVSLIGANYRSQDESGRVRYRCAMNFDIRPGDTARINGETFVVGELSYNVTVNNATLEIAEAVT